MRGLWWRWGLVTAGGQALVTLCLTTPLDVWTSSFFYTFAFGRLGAPSVPFGTIAAAGVAVRIIGATVIGLAQWRILHAAGGPGRAWVTATLLGAALLALLALPLSTMQLVTADDPPILSPLVVAWLGRALAFVALAPQAALLARGHSRGWWWLPAAWLGDQIGGEIAFALLTAFDDPFWRPGVPLGRTLLLHEVVSVAAALVSGLIAGLALTWILRPTRRAMDVAPGSIRLPADGA